MAAAARTWHPIEHATRRAMHRVLQEKLFLHVLGLA